MTNNSITDYRVLSIQSHVVSGYVGNKSAVFPLQVLGFEVDAINSVQFSNHSHYPHLKGQVLESEDLRTLYEGLKLNDLNKRYTHLLTGYARSQSFLETVHEVVQHVKSLNPNALYVCDPVMGDNGKMYVPQELLPIFRDKIIPMADVITPNQFEAEILTGIEIKTISDAIKAIDSLHSKGIPTVVLSSSDLSGNESELIALASSRFNGKRELVELIIPKFDAFFVGTGDLFTSLFLAWFTRSGHDLKTSFEKTVSTLQLILKRTFDYASKQTGGTKMSANVELRLIQSLNDIQNPKSIVKAIILE